jgi:two-component system cell cycle sensor histidine kinase/response regulator CckA
MSLEILWFCIICFVWVAYFVTEGFDFGVGMLLPVLGRSEADRRTMLQTIGSLKVIFVSGYAEENVRQDIADDRSVEFLAKPYSLDQINSKVKEVLGKRSDG